MKTPQQAIDELLAGREDNQGMLLIHALSVAANHNFITTSALARGCALIAHPHRAYIDAALILFGDMKLVPHFNFSNENPTFTSEFSWVFSIMGTETNAATPALTIAAAGIRFALANG